MRDCIIFLDLYVYIYSRKEESVRCCREREKGRNELKRRKSGVFRARALSDKNFLSVGFERILRGSFCYWCEKKRVEAGFFGESMYVCMYVYRDYIYRMYTEERRVSYHREGLWVWDILGLGSRCDVKIIFDFSMVEMT